MKLTPRERQVAELAADDQTDKLIAQSLGVSVHAVDQTWRRLKAKTKTCTRTGTVCKALADTETSSTTVFRS